MKNLIYGKFVYIKKLVIEFYKILNNLNLNLIEF